jgi:hypothetical protein
MKKGIDVSTIEIENVVVHTIPKHKKDDLTSEPKYSEEPSLLTESLKYFFRDKIMSALSSDKVFRLAFDTESTSPIPVYANDISNKNELGLIENSRKIAQHLFEVQSGNNNEGILMVIGGSVNDSPACIIVKLEMDKGAQLILNSKRKSYDIKEIEDLMLTQKTKVYKVVLFFNKANHKVQFDGMITDFQIDTKAKQDFSSWFISKFLGCTPFEDPRITTQHFFSYTRAYINTIDDDILKTKYYQDLNSYVQKNTNTLSPREFADDYFKSTTHKNGYKTYLDAKKFPFGSFTKDIGQIQRHVQKITMEFENGVTIIGKKGTFEKKVKFERLDNGQTKAEITSRVKKVG